LFKLNIKKNKNSLPYSHLIILLVEENQFKHLTIPSQSSLGHYHIREVYFDWPIFYLHLLAH